MVLDIPALILRRLESEIDRVCESLDWWGGNGESGRKKSRSSFFCGKWERKKGFVSEEGTTASTSRACDEEKMGRKAGGRGGIWLQLVERLKAWALGSRLWDGKKIPEEFFFFFSSGA